MASFGVPDRKSEITDVVWNYLLETGLSNASVGDLCRKTKLSQSSLYYWFSNVDDIWISAGRYGISKVVESLFDYTFGHTHKLREYFDTILDEVDKHKKEIRVAIQLTTSTEYGKLMRDKSKDFRLLYEKYGYELMTSFSCTYSQAETFIYSIICYVIDYVIWDDGEKTQLLLENLYDRIDKLLNGEQKED